MRHISEILDNLFDELDALTRKGATADGLPRMLGIQTGFSDLDVITAGFQKSDLVVVAGAPSSGKTSLVLGMVYGAAIGHAKSVGVFTLELSAEQIMQRILSMDSGVDTQRLRLGTIDEGEWDRVARAFGRLSEAPIFVDDSVLGIDDIRVRALQMKAEQSLDLVVIDSLQSLTKARGENRRHELSEISRKLKALARDLAVPIVTVSQLSDSAERREFHRPLLTDLRDSGSIEEDADVILFIYREDLYEHDSERNGIAEIIVAKHRNGPVGSICLRFFERTARFSDLELYPGPGSWAGYRE